MVGIFYRSASLKLEKVTWRQLFVHSIQGQLDECRYYFMEQSHYDYNRQK